MNKKSQSGFEKAPCSGYYNMEHSIHEIILFTYKEGVMYTQHYTFECYTYRYTELPVYTMCSGVQAITLAY